MSIELVRNLPYDHPYRWDGRRFGGVDLWQPSDLGSNLVMWFDAADADTITEDVGVSQWNDKSDNGYHVSQGTGTKQPTYANNRLSFDGGDALSRGTGPTIAQPFAVASVCQSDDFAANRYVWDCATRHLFGVVSGVIGITDVGDAPDIIGAYNSTAEAVHIGVFDGASSYTRANGSENDTGDVGSVSASGKFSIGSRNEGTLFFWLGDVAEFIITTDVSVDTIRKLTGYLAWKWGLE